MANRSGIITKRRKIAPTDVLRRLRPKSASSDRTTPRLALAVAVARPLMLSSKFSKRVSEARSARIAAESAALEAAREECAAAAKPPLKSSLKKSGGNQATPNAQAARAAIASKAAQALVPVLARGAVPPPSCCKRIRSKCCSGGCGGGRCSKCCDRSAGGAPEAVAAAAAAGRIREIRAVMEDSAVARDFAARSGPGEEAGTSCGSAMLAPCRAVQHTHSTNLLCSCTIFIAALHSLGRTVPLLAPCHLCTRRRSAVAPRHESAPYPAAALRAAPQKTGRRTGQRLFSRALVGRQTSTFGSVTTRETRTALYRGPSRTSQPARSLQGLGWGNHEAEALAAALAAGCAPSLTVLELQRNRIGDAGA